MDPKCIQEGFELSRNMDEVIELYDLLTEYDTTSIKSIKKSSDRQGITHKG